MRTTDVLFHLVSALSLQLGLFSRAAAVAVALAERGGLTHMNFYTDHVCAGGDRRLVAQVVEHAGPVDCGALRGPEPPRSVVINGVQTGCVARLYGQPRCRGPATLSTADRPPMGACLNFGRGRGRPPALRQGTNLDALGLPPASAPQPVPPSRKGAVKNLLGKIKGSKGKAAAAAADGGPAPAPLSGAGSGAGPLERWWTVSSYSITCGEEGEDPSDEEEPRGNWLGLPPDLA